MKRASRVYVGLVIAAGLVLLPLCVWRFIQQPTGEPMGQQLIALGCMAVVCAICRSAPIYITPEYGLDVSILPIIATVLLRGPYAAGLVYVISSLFTVEIDQDTRTAHHVYNTPLWKSAFNNANLLIAIVLPGLLILKTGYQLGDMRLPGVLLPMLLFTTLTFLINSLVLFVAFCLEGAMRPRDGVDMVKGLVPNVISCMPLGLLICYAFNRPEGYWLALLMVLPLMMARAAWKMYLDSRAQYLRLIQAFVASVEARDKYTEGHSRRVNQYAVMIAQHLRLKRRQVETIRVAALLHDIGKLGIEDAILLKPGGLTANEYDRIKLHPQIGASIVRQVQLDDAITDIILHHHERWDGKGYPDGLPGEKQSIGVQIMAVADAFDAMTSSRPYRDGLPMAEAVRRLKEGRGSQFSPRIVDAFLEALAQRREEGLAA